ncbi:UDP-N-acetylmuramoyl-tripeptide--D-alanyl-D-alanine ligase, partial [Corynebacterium casei]
SDVDTKYLVAELSARGIGHIKHLTDIATPRIGVVLNVGSAHLGEFGSRENIAKAKGELVEALPSVGDGGVAVLNADDPFVIAMAKRTAAKVVSYSSANPPAAGADYYATDISLDNVARPSFTLHAPGAQPVSVTLQVFGVHQVSNSLAAAAAAIEAGLSVEAVADSLSGHRNASAHRMDVHTRGDGVTIINDSYNANPDSMRAAIAALGYTTSGRPDARSIAVLGEMGELGEQAIDAHYALGAELAKFHVDTLIVVGDSKNCEAMADAAHERGINTMVSQDIDDAIWRIEDVLDTPPAGVEDWSQRELKDVVLVKASNAQRLWLVSERLLNGED